MTSPHILIIGAGYTGLRLAKHLQETQQARVTLFSRSKITPPPGISFIQGDLSRREDLDRIPSQLTGVAFCASASRKIPDSYHHVFVQGQQHLLKLLLERGDPIQRYVMMSTTGVYGDTQGRWVDESTPAIPTHPGPKTILEGEQLITKSDLPTTVIRFSGIYGPGRQRLIRSVQDNNAYILPGDPVFLNQIHVDDIVGVLTHVLQLANAKPCYLASDMEPATRSIVLSWLADEVNGMQPVEDSEKAPRPRHGNKRCKNQALVDSGYNFIYPTFREGYRALIKTESNAGA